jgi:hypothetical protein
MAFRLARRDLLLQIRLPRPLCRPSHCRTRDPSMSLCHRSRARLHRTRLVHVNDEPIRSAEHCGPPGAPWMLSQPTRGVRQFQSTSRQSPCLLIRSLNRSRPPHSAIHRTAAAWINDPSAPLLQQCCRIAKLSRDQCDDVTISRNDRPEPSLASWLSSDINWDDRSCF